MVIVGVAAPQVSCTIVDPLPLLNPGSITLHLGR
jgi:hypothetical protein